MFLFVFIFCKWISIRERVIVKSFFLGCLGILIEKGKIKKWKWWKRTFGRFLVMMGLVGLSERFLISQTKCWVQFGRWPQLNLSIFEKEQYFPPTVQRFPFKNVSVFFCSTFLSWDLTFYFWKWMHILIVFLSF